MNKLVVLLAVCIISLQAQDTASVEYTFTVTDEFNNSQELIIGKDPFGTNGLDPQFGECVVPQVPSGQFGARLILPTDSMLTIIKDIRFGCYWADGFAYDFDLSYETNSNQLYVDWDWSSSSPYMIIAIIFMNPYTSNQIQYFDFMSDTSFFAVPQNLDKLYMIVYYNGTLSYEEYRLLNPNGGDTLFVGNTYNISWWSNQFSPYINIEISTDGGNNWDVISNGVWNSQGNYFWTVPNYVSDSCLIRIGNYPCKFDISDNLFSIAVVVHVELLSFSSSVVDNDITLNWVTATETNNSGFQIERRETKNERSEEWNSIGFVNGNGSTTEPQTYYFKDENLAAGKYQYRLKQIDFEGTFEYSNIVEAEILPPAKFFLEQNYPNPFNPGTKISWQSPINSFQTLKVYDVLGNEIVSLVNEYRNAGKYEAEFNANKLSSGIYYYRLTIGEFIQTRKMIYLK